MISIQHLTSGRCAHWLFTTLILILAACISFLALHHSQRWHPDEAFYMTIARNAAVNGDWWLLSEPLDKPPLTYYLNALSLMLFAVDSDATGVLQLDIYKGELAGRLPSLWMSLVLVAVGMRLARALYRQPPLIWLTGLLLALSPLRIVFGPVAFTDMPMLLLALLALVLAAEGRTRWAGVLFGLSLVAKPQSIFYMPLLVGLIAWAERRKHPLNDRRIAQALLQFALLSCLPLLSVALWDGGRMAEGATSFLVLGQARYTPTTLTPLNVYPERLMTLWGTLRYSLGMAWLTALLGILTLWHSLKARHWLDWLLWAWCSAFVGAHIVLTLNLFDRNLLPLLPVMVVLVARMLSELRGTRLRYAVVFLALLGISLGSWQAARGDFEIGGDDGRHTGIDQLAEYLNSLPVATVIYDRWLDWELDYYMGQWTDKRRVYYPTPSALVSGVLALDEQGVRYFVMPTWEEHADWLAALDDAGFMPQLVYTSDNFRIYALSPLPPASSSA